MTNQNLTVINDFAAKVREKVKRDFAGMIPEEAWDALVQEAVQGFVKQDLQAVVKAELTEEVKKRLQDYFHRPEWQDQWDPTSGEPRASTAVRQTVRENLPLIIETVMGRAFQSFMNDVRNSFNRNW